LLESTFEFLSRFGLENLDENRRGLSHTSSRLAMKVTGCKLIGLGNRNFWEVLGNLGIHATFNEWCGCDSALP